MNSVPSDNKQLRATLYMLLTTFLFAVMGLQVRLVSPNISGGQSLFVRSVIDAAFTLIAMRLMRVSVLGTHHKALLLRGFLGALSGLAYFEAITRVKLADGISIYRSSALFMPVVALIALKEKLSVKRCLCAALGFAGVILLVKPGVAVQNNGAWIALLGAVLNACAWASVRSLAVRESALVIILYFYVACALFAGIIYGSSFVMPNLHESLSLLLMGLCGFFGQISLTKAYSFASATAITPLGYVEIIFMVIFGWTFFSELPDSWSWLGITMVASMGIIIAKDRTA